MQNWSRNITFADAQALYPASVEELAHIVASSTKIRARGSAHSFNNIADTDSVAVLFEKMPTQIAIDEEARTVTTSAGTRYGELAIYLHAQGWALHNLASLPHISIAGAIATSTHGSGIQNGGLHTAVKAITVITPTGKLQRIDSHDPLFYAAVVGLGLFGVVVTCELAISPTFDIAQVVFQDVARLAIADNYEGIMGLVYSVSYFTTWGPDGKGDLWTKRTESESLPTEILGSKPAPKKLHPLPGVDAIHCTEQLGVYGPWHERLPHFKLEFTPSSGDELQSEFFVPFEDASDAIRALEKIADLIHPNLLVSEFRTVAGCEFWMAGSYQRRVAAFHFTWKKIPEIAIILPIVEAALAPFSARPHTGKVFTVDSSYFKKVNPKSGDFKSAVVAFDPQNKFGNAFTDKLLEI